MKIAILGNSGSGKTTLAGQLAEAYGLPVLDLDTVAWLTGDPPTLRATEAAQDDVRRFCESHEAWVVEGCYGNLVRATLDYSPLLLFLDPGVEQCLSHCLARPFEPHKYSDPEEQNARLAFLLDWVRDYYVRSGDMSLQDHRLCFESYSGQRIHLTSLRPDDQPLQQWLSRAT